MELKIELYNELGRLISLSGRSNAEDFVARIVPRFTYLREGDKVVCDFDRIESCTISFLDGLFLGLKASLAKKAGVLLVVENISCGEVITELEALASYLKERRGVSFAVVYRNGERLEAIGNLDAVSKRVFQLLTERTLTARDLVELSEKDLKVNAASNQLKRLYNAGMALRREIIDTDGKKYVYYLK